MMKLRLEKFEWLNTWGVLPTALKLIKINTMKNYSIGLEPEVLEALQKIKDQDGVSIQWSIRKAVDDYLKKQKKGGQNVEG